MGIVRGVADPFRIIVLGGDQTGQELLEQSLRVLDAEVTGVEVELEEYDLSLDNRRSTNNEVVVEAARAMREAGFGIKAATITPEGADDVCANTAQVIPSANTANRRYRFTVSSISASPGKRRHRAFVCL